MRLLHLADWHLGRRTLRESRACDHDAVIAEIVAIARDAQPDLILHAGDLWDSARPGHDDLLRGVEALRELAAVAPVHVVCGNHDSPSLFRALGRLPGVAAHISFASADDEPVLRVPLAGGGRALVASVPYPHPNRSGEGGEPGTAYRDDLRRRLSRAAERLAADASAGDRLILGAHIHVAGAQLSSASASAARAEVHSAEQSALPELDYVALGHIHRPQAVGERARYAGSPLPLDFGEAEDRKSVALVTAEGPGAPVTELVPLTAGRRLVTIAAHLDDLHAHASEAADALCRAVITTDEPSPALADRVRAAWPDARVLDIVLATDDEPEPIPSGADEGAAPLTELLRDYLAADGVRGARLDRLLGRFADLAAAARHDRSYEPEELGALVDDSGEDGSGGDSGVPPERRAAGAAP